MHHQKICPEGDPPHQIVMKCLNRTRTQHRLHSSEINEVVGVNHQWSKTQFFATRTKRRSVAIWNARRAARPHPRTCRKDLEGIAPQPARRLQRVQITAADGGVNTDPQTAVHPSGRNGFSRRLRAVFVLRIKPLVAHIEWVKPQLVYVRGGVCQDSLRLSHSSVATLLAL